MSRCLGNEVSFCPIVKILKKKLKQSDLYLIAEQVIPCMAFLSGSFWFFIICRFSLVGFNLGFPLRLKPWHRFDKYRDTLVILLNRDKIDFAFRSFIQRFGASKAVLKSNGIL